MASTVRKGPQFWTAIADVSVMGQFDRSSASWIDIPVSANDPAGSALLTHFLNENHFPFEQSRRFFSIPVSAADRLESRVDVWAFRHEMPPDYRVEQSLDGKLRELGEIVLLAIAAAKANVAPNDVPAAGIDLTRNSQ